MAVPPLAGGARETAMAGTEHRVEFDFEIGFTNGGGINGQGFRLDIPGDDVTDDWVADAIVRDLRLLMVGPVRITNKRVLAEAHKRGPGGPRGGSPAPGEDAGGARSTAGLAGSPGARRLVDLSHPVIEGMTTYPGLPTPAIRPFLTREASAGHYAPGVTFAIDVLELCGNTGTYVDSPYHRYGDGADLASLPLDRLVDVPAVRVDVTGSSSLAVGARELLPYDLRGRAVLVHTGFARHWGTEAYLRDNPFLAPDAVDLLVREGAAIVGIDSLNIDSTADPERPAHSRLLAAGIPVCEHLTGLEQVPVDGAWFTALPAPVRDFGTFPVRAVASVPA
jgi:arylformamidase